MYGPSSLAERRIYYREEWSDKDLPDFIAQGITKREFGFDHLGNGPNDRYKVFKGTDTLRRFLRYKTPFAAYISVAFYQNPRKRGGWEKAEYIFDIDAKDLPIRSCNCDGVCEICLGEALERVNIMLDTLKGDLGLKNIHLIYSGRGFHIRILDPDMMEADSDLRAEVLKYVAGAEVPRAQYPNIVPGAKPLNFEHFSIPIAYPAVFTNKVKYNIFHLRGDETIDGINNRLLKDIIKNREFLIDDKWGLFKERIGPRRYKDMVNAMARVNLATIDAKVTIDLKRILRLPSSLHSKVSMKCVEVKNPETFDPFKHAVPKFVYERKDEEIAQN
ncbi:DNA primase small subunit PriA [Methanobrevibacter ruminantium M1]|uniref:DNA primase small subunit PriS n=1 Tax=Methanobrevibacter ruminantium (strain ATCC 35063 / DSM 1093 / JCM 13430 / OCM 146 / M1) TaxID=634498 RepID=D3E2R4_METRM|nr:DNA primase catalytic subunit PriS [Methanobrevibacter ruminantium]ADC46825.1 DNA primase small subunit PriA [Methanobrevibacter ruminantium M1]